jgi:hypothetical protein
MGYEVKMYVGDVSKYMKTEKRAAYFRVVGMVELFKVGDSAIGTLASRPEKDGTPIFMYDLDGNTEYAEDCYSEKLVALDPRKVLEVLRQDVASWPLIPTLRVAVAMLEAFLESEDYNLGVVLYGH